MLTWEEGKILYQPQSMETTIEDVIERYANNVKEQ